MEINGIKVEVAPYNASEEELLKLGYITKEEYDEMQGARKAVSEAIKKMDKNVYQKLQEGTKQLCHI